MNHCLCGLARLICANIIGKCNIGYFKLYFISDLLALIYRYESGENWIKVWPRTNLYIVLCVLTAHLCAPTPTVTFNLIGKSSKCIWDLQWDGITLHFSSCRLPSDWLFPKDSHSSPYGSHLCMCCDARCISHMSSHDLTAESWKPFVSSNK